VRLVLATRNEHKRREFARLLGGHTIESLADAVQLPPEDGETFADNASAKAWAAARATGAPRVTPGSPRTMSRTWPSCWPTPRPDPG
jgi:XTP/dITP diphosphohydrolase